MRVRMGLVTTRSGLGRGWPRLAAAAAFSSSLLSPFFGTPRSRRLGVLEGLMPRILTGVAEAATPLGSATHRTLHRAAIGARRRISTFAISSTNMMATLRIATAPDSWSADGHVRYERDLDRILTRVRREALDRTRLTDGYPDEQSG